MFRLKKVPDFWRDRSAFIFSVERSKKSHSSVAIILPLKWAVGCFLTDPSQFIIHLPLISSAFQFYIAKTILNPYPAMVENMVSS